MIYLVDILFGLGIFGLCFGYAVTKNTVPSKTVCWGVSVNAGPKVTMARYLCLICGILLGVGSVLWIKAMVDDAWSYDFDVMAYMVVPMLVLFLVFPFGLLFGGIWAERVICSERNYLFLGEFTPIQEAEAYIGSAKTVEIYGNGIALLNDTGYAYKTILFQEHRLGTLDNGKQLLLLSGYFLQKYPKIFKRKLVEDLSTSTIQDGTTNLQVSMANFGSSAGTLISSASGDRIQCIRLIRKA